MNVSVVIATYGEQLWADLAAARALPSLEGQGAYEVAVRHEPYGTCATSRNNAAALTSADWLCFLDADDELAPGYLGAMGRALERQLTPDGTEHGSTGWLLLTPAVQHIRKGRPGPAAFMDRGIPLTDDNWLVVGTLVQRDLFLKVGGFPEYPHGFEDWALWNKCWRSGARIIKVPDAVYRYFHNPQSKHKQAWRNRKWQVATHQRIAKELAEWTP